MSDLQLNLDAITGGKESKGYVIAAYDGDSYHLLWLGNNNKNKFLIAVLNWVRNKAPEQKTLSTIKPRRLQEK